MGWGRMLLMAQSRRQPPGKRDGTGWCRRVGVLGGLRAGAAQGLGEKAGGPQTLRSPLAATATLMMTQRRVRLCSDNLRQPRGVGSVSQNSHRLAEGTSWPEPGPAPRLRSGHHVTLPPRPAL